MISPNNLLKLSSPLVLASNSPRRKKLLQDLGFEFEIIPSNIEENIPNNKHNPIKYASELALQKVEDVANKIKKDYTIKDYIIIGADTIVVLEEKILNKPKDENDAFFMLKFLSGKTHVVYTGLALLNTRNNKKIIRTQKTEVTFRELDDEEISAYVATGSPMDKAGAYGIQDDFGAVFVKNISGCYYNIVGLPLEMLYEMLKEIEK
jgi:septum formation protein